MILDEPKMQEMLGGVRGVVVDLLRRTRLSGIAEELVGVAGSGKMLRVRMMFRVGAVTGVPLNTLKKTAAAIEMLHAASLLHDDVIDGAALRRGIPSFWVEKGVSGSILLGDLLVCQAFMLVSGVQEGVLLPELLALSNEVCEAETEQELILKGKAADWATCVSIARRKTGALFAYAGYVSGGMDEARRTALKNAGYTVGTAYQLGDDLCDAYGDVAVAGKTLGSDARAGKVTAVSASRSSGVDPQSYIDTLLSDSEKSLAKWPDVAAAWNEYLTQDLMPAIGTLVSPAGRAV